MGHQLRDATGRRASIWFRPTEARDVPAFLVPADPQGNRACLTTWRGRGSP
ncbi:hypothetical protein BH10ACT10_BH10ACT10_07650 [soil metagenome]